MINFKSFAGTITYIDEFFTGNEQEAGCYKIITIQGNDGNIVKFVIQPNTYVVDRMMLTIGDKVIGYYDALAPVPLIYPPQYRAIVIAKSSAIQNVKVSYFNDQLISTDGQLQLYITPYTLVLLENGQLFTGNIAKRNLVVLYGLTTKSIPAQTTPLKVIVLCTIK